MLDAICAAQIIKILAFILLAGKMLEQCFDEGNGVVRILDNHVQLCTVTGGQQHGFGDIVVIAQTTQDTGNPFLREIEAFTNLNGGCPVIET